MRFFRNLWAQLQDPYTRRVYVLGFVCAFFSSLVVALVAPRFSSAWAPAMVLLAWPVQSLVGFVMGSLGFLNVNHEYVLGSSNVDDFCKTCSVPKDFETDNVPHLCACKACSPEIWYTCPGCGKEQPDRGKYMKKMGGGYGG